jgi:hypothetical protein
MVKIVKSQSLLQEEETYSVGRKRGEFSLFSSFVPGMPNSYNCDSSGSLYVTAQSKTNYHKIVNVQRV